MFAGIVEATGQIVRVDPRTDGVRLLIEAPQLDLGTVTIGDSIAVNGACMTVVEASARTFSIDVSAESLARTVRLDRIGVVNLETSLRLGDRIDGHLVSGHVDGTGVIAELTAHGEHALLLIDADPALSPYLAYKGSVTVDGISLTVNQVEDLPSTAAGAPGACRIWINLIPHTIAVTTLRDRRPGERVNLEVDMIARYVARMLRRTRAIESAP